jgi:chaperonin GroEL
MNELKFGLKARLKIKEGIDEITNAVKVTLGPNGRNVIIYHPPINPQITKDGVTVARNINLDDDCMNIGAQLIKDVANNICKEAGDGTTTGMILAQAIYDEGIKYISTGVNTKIVKDGIDIAIHDVISFLEYNSLILDASDKEGIKNIANISSNQDSELSEMLSDLISKIGKDGVITVEESKNKTYIEIIEGLKIENRGYINPYFSRTPKDECILENVYILVTDNKISNTKEILHVLDMCSKTNSSLLIICEDMEPPVQSDILINVNRNTLKACVIKCPSFGESRRHELKDILSVVGGSLGVDNLGRADKVIVTANDTLIIGGKGDPAELIKRIGEIKLVLERDLNERTREIIQKRLAKLTNGVAILYIGAKSELELNEKKDRADDTIRAINAAIQEGTLPGGGTMFIKAAKYLRDLPCDNDDHMIGREIVYNALHKPLTQICLNCDVNSGEIIYKVSNSGINIGYNAVTNKVEDLRIAGVIDPTKVLKVCLENAASISSLLLTTECIVIRGDKIPLIQ